MALTGADLLTGISKFMKDYWASTTTSAGASDGTTLIDTKLSRFGDDYLRGWYVRITNSGTNQYAVRRIFRSTRSSGTLEFKPAFAAQVAGSVTYELHRYDPVSKFDSLDAARLLVFPDLAKFVFDDTTTADGESQDFAIPASIRKGPAFVFAEIPMSRMYQWNFSGTPQTDSLTNWTATNLTPSLVSRSYDDLLIPKFAMQCTQLAVAASTHGTYVQTVSNMRNSMTAAKAAGKTMTFAQWVYSNTASKWTLKVTDDAGTTTSVAHQGLGWELLHVTRNISATNSTTLTTTLDAANDTNASVAWLDGSWFYYGSALRVTESYDNRFIGRVRRDDTVQQCLLDVKPPRGAQLRFVGMTPLSALGDSVTTQVTNSMEIDEPAAPLLYAEAASYLFESEAIQAAMPEELNAKIGVTKSRKSAYAVRWPMRLPAGATLKGWA